MKPFAEYKLSTVPALTVLERASFYGVWVLSAMVWLLHFEAQPSSPAFVTSQICVVLLAALPLALMFSRTGAPAAIKNLELFLPGAISLLWAFGAFSAPDTAPSSTFVFSLLALLSCLLARPFGLFIWLSVSLPLVVVINDLILNVLNDSLGVVTLMNLLFVGLGFSLGLANPDVWRGKVSSAKTRQSVEQELDQLRYEKNRLKSALLKTEQELEQKIQFRTEALQDANIQLNQQVALRKSVSEALVKSQTRLTQAIEASRLGLIDWEIENGKFYQSNFHHIFGEKELSSQNVIETLKRIVHTDDYAKLRDTLNACLCGDMESYQLAFRVRDANVWRWIEESGRVVDVDDAGRALRLMGTRRDIHSEVQRNEEVRLAKSVFDHTSEGVFVLDAHKRFLSVNPAYTDVTGQQAETIVGKSLVDVSQTPQANQVYDQIFEALEDKGQWQGELLEKRLHGDYFPQFTQINVISDTSGGVKYYAGLISDMSDHREADEKLDYLLNYDGLTRLANRVQFQNQLHRALMRWQNDNLPFALVLMDVDRFKHFNDSYGHEASDAILQTVAERLSNNVQRVDVLARIGGNEFACIVACSPTFQVTKFAERLFHSLTDKPYSLAGSEVVLSCSVGIALVPEHTESIEMLVRYGALAVQKAKYSGGNQIQLFDESLKTFSRERLEIEKELRSGLANNELEVFYQPKLDLHQGLIRSYEALVRWNHPERGLISPQEFVAIAEENGLISDLGAYVLRAAAKQTKQWQNMGFGDLSVSVNLSPRQLLDASITHIIEEVLDESQIAPQFLELELTETALMEDVAGVVARLKELRALGVKVSIDDFGTGYSSLSYLRTLPVDTLKIDREFIENIEHSKEQQAITRAIVVLGASLDLSVVAEGAENEEQLELLRELGCDYVQGYYVSKPLERQAMETLLENQSQ